VHCLIYTFIGFFSDVDLVSEVSLAEDGKGQYLAVIICVVPAQVASIDLYCTIIPRISLITLHPIL